MLVVCPLKFNGPLVKISEKCNSHRNKAFLSSLEDTPLGPKAADQNGSLVLHVIVEKVNMLLVCPLMILRSNCKN